MREIDERIVQDAVIGDIKEAYLWLIGRLSCDEVDICSWKAHQPKRGSTLSQRKVSDYQTAGLCFLDLHTSNNSQ